MKLRTMTTLAVSALTISASLGIELLEPIPLPDMGFGSDAQVTVDWGDGAAVCGSVRDMFGRNLPFVWDLDNDGIVVGSTALPIPSGFQGNCQSANEFASGNAAAVGTLIAPNGTQHAVLWRRSGGVWNMPVQLLPYLEQSNLSSDPNAACGDSLVMYCAVNGLNGGGILNGFMITITDGRVRSLLLPSGGRPAMCLGVEPDESGNLAATCGWVLAPNGLRRPAVWDLDNDGQFDLNLLQAPQNSSGEARGLAIDDGLWHVVGELSRNGRSMAAEWDLNNDGLLRPLEGYANASAYNLGDTGTHEVGHIVVGESSMPGQLPVATAWLNGLATPVQQMLLFSGSVGQILGFSFGVEREVVGAGQVLLNPAAEPQAAAFRGTNTNVPSIIAILIGFQAGGDQNPAEAWHDDTESFDVRTRMFQGSRRAVTDLILDPMGFTAGQDARMDAQFTVPGNQVSGGVINVYLRNFATSEYEQVHSVTVAAGDVNMDLMLSGYGPQHHHPTTGSVYMRIEFVQNGNKPGVFGIDMVRLITE